MRALSNVFAGLCAPDVPQSDNKRAKIRLFIRRHNSRASGKPRKRFESPDPWPLIRSEKCVVAVERNS